MYTLRACVWAGGGLKFDSNCTCVNWLKNCDTERDEEEEGRVTQGDLT
jgi:hypothetical protein